MNIDLLALYQWRSNYFYVSVPNSSNKVSLPEQIMDKWITVFYLINDMWQSYWNTGRGSNILQWLVLSETQGVDRWDRNYLYLEIQIMQIIPNFISMATCQ